MKHIFIIDENVTMAALTYERPDRAGERDLRPALLLTTMFQNCHRFAESPTTYARWSAKVQEVRAAHRALNPALPMMMSQARAMEGKCPWPMDNEPPELPEEYESIWTGPLVDDRDFIRLAAHFTGSFLVTFDVRLRGQLETLGLDVKYRFQVVTPDEALPLASEPSDDS